MLTTVTSAVGVIEEVFEFVTGNTWLVGLLGISVVLGVSGSILAFFRR